MLHQLGFCLLTNDTSAGFCLLTNATSAGFCLINKNQADVAFVSKQKPSWCSIC
jgi:hypothetical protein